jgi:hypothetical protein
VCNKKKGFQVPVKEGANQACTVHTVQTKYDNIKEV